MPSYLPSNRFRLNLRELIVCKLPHEIFYELPTTNYELIYMAYAIIQTGGKQYRVESGNEIDVEKLDVEVGTDIDFSEVLLVSDGADLQVGEPFVSGAKVSAEVVDQFKDDKVIAFKFRRRKGYHRTVGHRRQLTRLKIKTISTK